MEYSVLLPTIQEFCQHKVFNNVLYLNQKLHQFGIVSCSKCPFSDLHDETSLYLFYDWVYAKNIWHKFSLYLAEKFDLLVLTSKSVMFGFDDIQD